MNLQAQNQNGNMQDIFDLSPSIPIKNYQTQMLQRLQSQSSIQKEVNKPQQKYLFSSLKNDQYGEPQESQQLYAKSQQYFQSNLTFNGMSTQGTFRDLNDSSFQPRNHTYMSSLGNIELQQNLYPPYQQNIRKEFTQPSLKMNPYSMYDYENEDDKTPHSMRTLDIKDEENEGLLQEYPQFQQFQNQKNKISIPASQDYNNMYFKSKRCNDHSRKQQCQRSQKIKYLESCELKCEEFINEDMETEDCDQGGLIFQNNKMEEVCKLIQQEGNRDPQVFQQYKSPLISHCDSSAESENSTLFTPNLVKNQNCIQYSKNIKPLILDNNFQLQKTNLEYQSNPYFGQEISNSYNIDMNSHNTKQQYTQSQNKNQFHQDQYLYNNNINSKFQQQPLIQEQQTEEEYDDGDDKQQYQQQNQIVEQEEEIVNQIKIQNNYSYDEVTDSQLISETPLKKSKKTKRKSTKRQKSQNQLPLSDEEKRLKKNFFKNICFAFLQYIHTPLIKEWIQDWLKQEEINTEQFFRKYNNKTVKVNNRQQFKDLFFLHKSNNKRSIINSLKQKKLLRYLGLKFVREEIVSYTKYETKIRDFNVFIGYRHLFLEALLNLPFDE